MTQTSPFDELYSETAARLDALPYVAEWPAARTHLAGMAAERPSEWLLPVIACEAVGGDAWQAAPAMVALACLQFSIILVDDILDDDPRGAYRRMGAGPAANMALALQAAAQSALAPLPPARRLLAMQLLNETALATARGQDLDIQPIADEATYWRMVGAKSVPFFRDGLRLGALLGGADAAVDAQLARFGAAYGEMIQIHDDLQDTMEEPANPDWLQGRSPLPILFAEQVDHPDRDRFRAARAALPASAALAEAQEILVACGAVSFCADQLLRRYGQARTCLAELSLPRPEPLALLLEETIAPVTLMFETLGLAEAALLLRQYK